MVIETQLWYAAASWVIGALVTTVADTHFDWFAVSLASGASVAYVCATGTQERREQNIRRIRAMAIAAFLIVAVLVSVGSFLKFAVAHGEVMPQWLGKAFLTFCLAGLIAWFVGEVLLHRRIHNRNCRFGRR